MNKKEIAIKDLLDLAKKHSLINTLDADYGKVGRKLAKTLAYNKELELLQRELVKLQNWTVKNNKRILIIFEGRDTAGKSGTIRRFAEALNPRHQQIVALPKPTPEESTQWYFQRYIKNLPSAGQIYFFDRSWYNRALVEPVMGFCTQLQYNAFMSQVSDVENMLVDDGIILVKFWFSVSKDTQKKRFADRKKSVVKSWKISAIDKQAQAKWNDYTKYIQQMFERTIDSKSKWVIVKSDHKKDARLESMKYVLNLIDYENKDPRLDLTVNENIVFTDFKNPLMDK